MWWGWSGHRHTRQWNWLPFFLIFLAIALITGGRGSWFMWIILWFVVVPVIRGLFSSGWSQQGDYEKRKRQTGDVVIIEKPKREPQYAVGDDGELVEIYDEEDFAEKPKRLQSGNDDFEYV